MNEKYVKENMCATKLLIPEITSYLGVLKKKMLELQYSQCDRSPI